MRRAFATVTAVVLLGLAAAALAALATLFTSDYRRTREAQADAQLRQLLIAGAAEVSEKAKAWPDSPPDAKWDVLVPGSLAADGGHVSNQTIAGENQTIEVHIKAGYLARTAAQTVRYHHEAGRWILTDATIDPEVH
ncbi:MAG TPA: hypothetical protein VG269_23025 [Tepidisphaeraceae bacterium]|nr:hypothetical protein [Tepidisphaeraceae bacterium]